MRRTREHGILGRRIRGGNRGAQIAFRALEQTGLQIIGPRQGAAHEANDLADGLNGAVGVSGGPPQTQKESGVPGDAVAHVAEPREIHEQPFLEKGRLKVVQVGEARERPQVGRDFRRLRRQAEEVRQHAEAPLDVRVELCQRGDVGRSTHRPHRHRPCHVRQ
jgi:hypothetical protein